MKSAVSWVILPAIGVAICWAVGLVSFTSVTTVPNDPLAHPCKVKELDGMNLVLENGQVVGLDQTFSRATDISNRLARSDFQIDIEHGETNGPGFFDIVQGDTNRLDIYVRRLRRNDSIRPFVITIPFVRKTVGANDRAWIASGRYVFTKSQPER